jgi:ankyrin repeat protein
MMMCRILEQIDVYLERSGGEIANRLENQLRQPPLYFAINLPDDPTCLSVLKKLVAKGANARFKDQNEQTIIFYACRDGNIYITLGKTACVDYLVSLGVSLFEEDAYGQTPLYYIAN